MAIGCTHGVYADQTAIDTVLAFADRWKPERRIHLGDVGDYAAFRTGAKGTKDEAAELEPDSAAVVSLIERYAPTDLLIGNHDLRIWRATTAINAITAKAAQALRNEFLTACDKVGANVIDTYDINRSYLRIADTLFLHGFMYGEQALRDHAEHFGRCVHAHWHKPGIAHGRRADHPTAFCVGTLADIEKLEYANTRRATAAWGQAFTFGEYNDTHCTVNLCERQGDEWRLPL